jgi:hypothetical protein
MHIVKLQQRLTVFLLFEKRSGIDTLESRQNGIT